MAKGVDIYENTPENATRIGWDRFRPLGDPSKTFVFHAAKYGIFFYIDKNEKDMIESVDSIDDVRIGLS